MKDGETIARSAKVRNKLQNKMIHRYIPGTTHSDCTFNALSPAQTWETWQTDDLDTSDIVA